MFSTAKASAGAHGAVKAVGWLIPFTSPLSTVLVRLDLIDSSRELFVRSDL